MEVVGSPSKIWKYVTWITSKYLDQTNKRCQNIIRTRRTSAATDAVMVAAMLVATVPAKQSLNMLNHGAYAKLDDKLVIVHFVEQHKKQYNKNLYLFRFSLARDKQAFSLTYLICQLFVDSEFSVAKHLKSHECLHQKLNEIQVRVDL